MPRRAYRARTVPVRVGPETVIADPVSLAAIVAAAAALAIWLESRFGWGPKVGAALLAILFGALLSNLELVPLSSPIYDGIFGPVTSLAIVWLLFAVRLDDLRQAGPAMLGAFGIAVAGTALGAAAAGLFFADAFGDEAWKLAGVMTGTYSGGSLNFVAVGRELELPGSLFSAAAAADNVLTAVWMGATLVLPVWLRRLWRPGTGARSAAAGDSIAARPGERAGGGGEAPEPTGAPTHPLFAGERPGILDAAVLLALGLGLLRAAEGLAAAVPAIPSVLWLTTLALLVAQLPPVRRLSGAMQLGYLSLHFFFVLIGVSSRVEEILRVGPEVLYLTATVVAIHGLVIYGAAWLARIGVETASVASQAAVGGPSTALALAVARGWPALALPGLAVGLLGYAVGNYAGLGIARLMRALLGS